MMRLIFAMPVRTDFFGVNMRLQRELLSDSACLGVHAASLFRLALIQQSIASILGAWVGSRLSLGYFNDADCVRAATRSSSRYLSTRFGYLFRPLHAWHTHGEKAFASCMRLRGTFLLQRVRALELTGRAFPPTVTAGANAAKIQLITDGMDFKNYSSLEDKAAKPLHIKDRQSHQD